MRVPEYVSTEQLSPLYQRDLDANATPEAFGAAVGRGLENLGAGMGRLAGAIGDVQDYTDQASAKDALSSLAAWRRERMYGEGGYMTLSGANAVQGREQFEKDFEAKRKEFGTNLTPGAGRYYGRASQADMNSAFETAIVHQANERKSWVEDASNSRLSSFQADAMTNYGDDKQVNKYIAAGLLELREQGKTMGWDGDTQKLKEKSYISGVFNNVVLKIAETDPLAADAYMKSHADQMLPDQLYKLQTGLKDEIVKAKSQSNAADILGTARGADDPKGGAGGVSDATGAGGADASPAPPMARGSVGTSGPTRARDYLTKVLVGHGPESIDGLDQNFATNLAAMMEDAPPDIRAGLGLFSGYRSNTQQSALYARALAKYGSPDVARRWVAPPGKSQHNLGRAVDLSWNGQSLANAPRAVVDWVHQNAAHYGLWFPMSNENWHIEPFGSRANGPQPSAGDGAPAPAPQPYVEPSPSSHAGVSVGTVAAKTDGAGPRVGFPSMTEIESRLAAIQDPDEQAATRTRVYAIISAQNSAAEATQKAAVQTLWSYIDQGKTPDDVPMDVRQSAGMTAVGSAWDYLNKVENGHDVTSDETLLYKMRRDAASDPVAFSNLDLNDYRNRLSRADIKELTGLQTSAITDATKAKRDGSALTAAYSQADDMLEAAGITMTGKTGSDRQLAAQQIAQFHNSMAANIEAFKQKEGRMPMTAEIQALTHDLLLPTIVKTPPSFWNTWRGGESSGFMFQAKDEPEGLTVQPNAAYTDIPDVPSDQFGRPDRPEVKQAIVDGLTTSLGRPPTDAEALAEYNRRVMPFSIRERITSDLEQSLGRKPSQAEITAQYNAFIQREMLAQ